MDGWRKVFVVVGWRRIGRGTDAKAYYSKRHAVRVRSHVPYTLVCSDI
jgi:hypothetical protein